MIYITVTISLLIIILTFKPIVYKALKKADIIDKFLEDEGKMSYQEIQTNKASSIIFGAILLYIFIVILSILFAVSPLLIK